MKSISTPTIVFAIFLSIWVHGTISILHGDSPYNPRKLDKFLNRLENAIAESAPDRLPFTAKDHAIQKLKETSVGFKKLCIFHETRQKWRTGEYSPIDSLHKTIKMIFFEYKKSNPSKENKRIINEIQAVDPIGLNAYLTKQNESYSSPTFMKSVEDFRNTGYKEVPIAAGSNYSMKDFLDFTQRIKTIIEKPSYSNNVLPFTLQIRLIANLWMTSAEFKELCVDNEMKRKHKAPIRSLKRAIRSVFYQYKHRMNGNEEILNEIESLDPIGLNVYLKSKFVTISSPDFEQTVNVFHSTMIDRVQLFKSGKDDSYIEMFKENPNGELHKIPENIRKEITSEYKFLNHETMDFFIEIAMEQFHDIKMYSVTNYHSKDKYLLHNSSETNDVQILYSGEIGSEYPGHAVCIYYKASTRKVLLYDSAMNDELDPINEEIIRILYPYNTGIIFQTPRTLQGQTETCAVYAITYATALLLGTDPLWHEFRSNDIYGEDALYLRLHILNMFANRKLILMK